MWPIVVSALELNCLSGQEGWFTPALLLPQTAGQAVLPQLRGYLVARFTNIAMANVHSRMLDLRSDRGRPC